MFCTKCGASVGDAKFCPKCGAKLYTLDEAVSFDEDVSLPKKSRLGIPDLRDLAMKAVLYADINAAKEKALKAGAIVSEKADEIKGSALEMKEDLLKTINGIDDLFK